MARRGSLNFIELHIEKFLLGLAALFLVGLIGYYAMGPNRVEYSGREIGPSELPEVVAVETRQLEQAIKRAEPKEYEVPRYRDLLEAKANEGILDAKDDGPAVPSSLTLAAPFGTPLPEFEDDIGGKEDVELVTPLPPTPPVARTGISLVEKLPPLTLGADAPVPPPDASDEPVEVSWVTLASYFPREAQRNEMINEGGYAGYLSKAYVVGTDVERQEMLANGDWGEWELITTTDVMPRVPIPTPAFDDNTGEMLNEAELEEALYAIRYYQKVLMEPPFYPVYSGDEWKLPPLVGQEEFYEEPDLAAEDQEKPDDEGLAAATPRQPTRRFPGRRTTPRGGPPVGGGRFGGVPRTPPGRGAGSTGSTPQAGQSEAEIRRENLRAIRKALADASDALKEKDFASARQLAESVLTNKYAKRGDKRRAERVLSIISGGSELGTPTVEELPLITHPETEEPAVWFHDTTVEPGKTYRYRMRVRLWNRYVGRLKALKNPAEAKKTVLVGEWSLPGDPITVARKQHFFVTGRVPGEQAARVEVFNWRQGNWLRESFEVRTGDIIGGVTRTKTGEYDMDLNPVREDVDFTTGAVVLDLRLAQPVLQRRLISKEEGDFSYTDRESLVLVYLDPVDGQVKERIASVDRTSELYEDLDEQYEEYVD